MMLKFGRVKQYKQYYINLFNWIHIEVHGYYHGLGFNIYGELFQYNKLEQNVFNPYLGIEFNTGFGGIMFIFNMKSYDT